MSSINNTFFTSLGCMDGRVQNVISEYGRIKFGAQFPDTITEAGLDGLLGDSIEQTTLDSLKKKILISVEKHHSQGIVFHGHEDCAGNPVSEKQHKQDIKNSVEKLKSMLKEFQLPIFGVYVKVSPDITIEQVS